MPSKVTCHITSIDTHKYGHMLLSTFNHLFALRSFNNGKNLMTHLNGWHLALPMKTPKNMEQIHGNLKAHSKCDILRKFEFFFKTFTNYKIIISNLGDLHITSLETLHDKLL